MTDRVLYYGQPINWAHPLNRGLLIDSTIVPWYASGPRLINLASRLHGTLTAAPTIDGALGRHGGYGSLNLGNTQYIDFSQSSYDLGVRRNATFAGWVRRKNTTSTNVVLSDWASSNGFNLRTDDNVTATFYIYPNNHRITYTGTFTTGVWYHLAGVMDGATMYLYVNGVQVASETLGEDIGSSGSSLKIGTRSDLADGFSSAFFDGATIHSRSLSAMEMRAFYLEQVRGNPTRWSWIDSRTYYFGVTAAGAASVGGPLVGRSRLIDGTLVSGRLIF